MSERLDRYLSFRGRLAPLPFFLRELSPNITAAVITFASIPLFASGSRVLRWAGLFVPLASLVLLAMGTISLIVRRFHDLNLSGYHAIWFAAVEVTWVAITYGPPEAILLAARSNLFLAGTVAWYARRQSVWGCAGVSEG